MVSTLGIVLFARAIGTRKSAEGEDTEGSELRALCVFVVIPFPSASCLPLSSFIWYPHLSPLQGEPFIVMRVPRVETRG
jgi:hypothetical protein